MGLNLNMLRNIQDNASNVFKWLKDKDSSINTLQQKKYKIRIGSVAQFGAGITSGDDSEHVLCAVKTAVTRKAFQTTAAKNVQRMPLGYLYHDNVVGGTGKLWYAPNNADNASEISTFQGVLSAEGIPSGWHFAIGEAGEIIAVIEGDVQARGQRVPRVLTSADNYAASNQVAFTPGVDTYPIGWLQNCGMDFGKDASGNEYFIFGEYTGASTPDKKVYLWKVTKPYTSRSNWRIVGTFNQTTNNTTSDGDAWHIHSVQQDPYTNIWYVTTGDTDTSCCWYKSEDHGENWTKIVNGAVWGSQINRVLNLVFTKDYIYWANDYGTNHGLYRLPRDANGKMNVSVAPTKLSDLNKNQSTYATIMLHEPNGLLMLDRVDIAFSGNTNKLDISFWSFDDNQLYILDTLTRRADAPSNEFGFRCKAYTLNQGINDKRIIVGFGEYANRLDLPWNDNGRRTTLALEIY